MGNVSVVGRVFFSKSKDGEYGKTVTLGLHIGNDAGIFVDINKANASNEEIAKGDYVYISDMTVSARAGTDRPLANSYRTYAMEVSKLSGSDSIRMSSTFHLVGTYIGMENGQHVLLTRGRVNPKTKEVTQHKVMFVGEVPETCKEPNQFTFISGVIKSRKSNGKEDKPVAFLEADRVLLIGG